MAMRLIKKASRGDVLRELTAEEEQAVKSFFGQGLPAGRDLAEKVIRMMRQQEAWLQCDCVPDDAPALNSAKMMGESRKLFLSGFNHEHASGCPMFREFSGDKGATRCGTRKTPGSTRITLRDFLPPDDRLTTIKAPGKTAAQAEDRTRRRRRSSLARVLLTLIEDAGLNQLVTLSPLPEIPPAQIIQMLKDVTRQQAFTRGHSVSDIIRFDPWLSDKGAEAHMTSLEQPETYWPAGKAHIFCQVFMTDTVSRDSTTFRLKKDEYHFRPERGISINGESQDGIRPPYWVILAFRRGADGRVLCSEGYAHALYQRRCPVPVDSKLERKTLDSLAEVAGWMSKKEKAPVLSLIRPLFDTEVSVDGDKGYVLPDFIVRADTDTGRKHTIIIETMGYTDDDYCERKI